MRNFESLFYVSKIKYHESLLYLLIAAIHYKEQNGKKKIKSLN